MPEHKEPRFFLSKKYVPGILLLVPINSRSLDEGVEEEPETGDSGCNENDVEAAQEVDHVTGEWQQWQAGPEGDAGSKTLKSYNV